MAEGITIYVDGATSWGKQSGVAAVARSPEGYFLGWSSRQLPHMTNNEAEYQAALLGLELAAVLAAGEVEIVSDSEVMVNQMSGRSQVHSARLKQLHTQTCLVVRRFERVAFRHVRRKENQLADALATEALLGRVVRMPPAGSSPSALASLMKKLRR